MKVSEEFLKKHNTQITDRFDSLKQYKFLELKYS